MWVSGNSTGLKIESSISYRSAFGKYLKEKNFPQDFIGSCIANKVSDEEIKIFNQSYSEY